MSIVVRKVTSPKGIKQFHAFSRKLYASDEQHVSHIDQDIESIFDSKKNNSFDGGDAQRWIAYKGNEVVGKIAAFYNRVSSQSGIGFIDFIDSKDVAFALFDTGVHWLKQNGFTEVEAPVNFGERDKYWGLLVEGFKNPSYQESYNYPYYEKYFEEYGFEKIIEQTTSEAKPDDIDFDKYKKFTDRLLERGELRAEHFRISEMKKFVKDFTTIYNQAWEGHEHFVPFTEERVGNLFKEMKSIIREDLLWFLYDGDEPIGFYLSIIDLNQILRYLNGSMNLWGKIKFLWYRKTVKITRVRGIIFGVIPRFHSKGVYSVLIMKMYEVMKNDPYLESSELAWIGDFNPKMHALFESLNAKKTKVHFTFKKVF